MAENEMPKDEYICKVCGRMYKRDEDWNHYVIWRTLYGLCEKCTQRVVKGEDDDFVEEEEEVN